MSNFFHIPSPDRQLWMMRCVLPKDNQPRIPGDLVIKKKRQNFALEETALVGNHR
jgi:hypothetical protein